MKTDKEVLIEARGYIEQGWAKGSPAYNSQHVAVSPTDPLAVCWCSLGAIQKAVPDPVGMGQSGFLVIRKLAQIVSEADGTNPMAGNLMKVIDFNDRLDTTKEQVLALFDKAIEKCDEV